ncbi:N-acetylneuraminate synthase [Sulfitobacter litoralis]|uniref:N-acetylneuraminate synthase n=1 Tax=Sulfitobacter litoralis TaxID=335975 RepID=A0ABY0SU87_9RHOB|nr:N-acetylneuraminate synthase family protein [Sulfitobacter litoralis]SDP61378.1 N-acetylneuraminate synthase [Sulfitobacter litoralis]
MKHLPNAQFKIGEKLVGKNCPTYFVADIGANHDGDLGRAKELIHSCAEAGADAAKFQHFQAKSIVSDQGFKKLDPTFMSHQSKWKKSIFEVYQSASIDMGWTTALREACDDAGIEFMTTPYAPNLVDHIDPFVSAYKIGSGDITWIDQIEYIASKGKPILLACGASTLDETVRAMASVLKYSGDVSLLQCNTNYTASLENFDYINLNVLKTFSAMYPDAITGLSDHTPGHATALGAVALGGRIIEKHFTDDNNRDGPDHKFAMNPESWRSMVDRTRELERALGTGIKKVEDNERDTVVIQRRALRASSKFSAGHVLRPEDIEILRPCPLDAIPPHLKSMVVGKTVREPMEQGDHFTSSNLT